MSSHPLFDRIFPDNPIAGHKPLTGEQLRDSGVQAALDRALRIKLEYVNDCLEAIASFPSGTMLTSEDVREKAGDPPDAISPNYQSEGEAGEFACRGAAVMEKAMSAKLKIVKQEVSDEVLLALALELEREEEYRLQRLLDAVIAKDYATADKLAKEFRANA